MEAEDELNQKIAELIISMSEVAVYIVDVKQFATMAQLKAVIEEANGLVCRAVNIFNKHKESNILGECSSSEISRFSCSKYPNQRGCSQHFRKRPRKSSKAFGRTLPGSKMCSTAVSQFRL